MAAGPNTGAVEGGVVTAVNDNAARYVHITITPTD